LNSLENVSPVMTDVDVIAFEGTVVALESSVGTDGVCDQRARCSLTQSGFEHAQDRRPCCLGIVKKKKFLLDKVTHGRTNLLDESALETVDLTVKQLSRK
jgi:hypothetical protein